MKDLDSWVLVFYGIIIVFICSAIVVCILAKIDDDAIKNSCAYSKTAFGDIYKCEIDGHEYMILTKKGTVAAYGIRHSEACQCKSK